MTVNGTDSGVHRVATRRIITGRAPEFMVTDPERSRRLIAGQLPWLHRLDAADRYQCLTEAAAALRCAETLETVLERWHPDPVTGAAH